LPAQPFLPQTAWLFSQAIFYYTDMISVFREDGKPLLEIDSDAESSIILSAQKSFDPARAICAGCGAGGFLSFYCQYTRWVIVLEDGAPKDKELKLDRYKCSICGKTHVVAPGEAVIPYMRHSLGFIAAALGAWAKREKPMRAIAQDFQIALSTLCEWIKRFRDHYELLFGKLEAAAGDAGARIGTLRQASSAHLFTFAETYRLGFMQAKRTGGATRCFSLRGHLVPCRGGSP